MCTTSEGVGSAAISLARARACWACRGLERISRQPAVIASGRALIRPLPLRHRCQGGTEAGQGLRDGLHVGALGMISCGTPAFRAVMAVGSASAMHYQIAGGGHHIQRDPADADIG